MVFLVFLEVLEMSSEVDDVELRALATPLTTPPCMPGLWKVIVLSSS